MYLFTQKDKCENLRRIILFGVEVELHVGMANELASDANKLNACWVFTLLKVVRHLRGLTA